MSSTSAAIGRTTPTGRQRVEGRPHVVSEIGRISGSCPAARPDGAPGQHAGRAEQATGWRSSRWVDNSGAASRGGGWLVRTTSSGERLQPAQQFAPAARAQDHLDIPRPSTGRRKAIWKLRDSVASAPTRSACRTRPVSRQVATVLPRCENRVGMVQCDPPRFGQRAAAAPRAVEEVWPSAPPACGSASRAPIATGSAARPRGSACRHGPRPRRDAGDGVELAIHSTKQNVCAYNVFFFVPIRYLPTPARDGDRHALCRPRPARLLLAAAALFAGSPGRRPGCAPALAEGARGRSRWPSLGWSRSRWRGPRPRHRLAGRHCLRSRLDLSA